MEVPKLVGYLLLTVGLLDFAVGHLFVIPRVKAEATRPKLRAAFTVASLLTIALGTSFLVGWIG